jgi:hopanoid biosynthesis associated protein HpnK
MKAAIFTADDFGVSVPLNEAVERGHSHGILTAASMLVGAPYAEDAVERARRLPTLGVGLHLALVDARPVLPRHEIPDLVGPDGRFSRDPVEFGIKLFFSARLQQQAEAELEAQFARFRATGLQLDHVNGHQHFHVHPTVSRIIQKIAPKYGSPPVRIPNEPLVPSYRAGRDRPILRLASWILFSLQMPSLRRRLREIDLACNDYVFGLCDSGEMTERRLLNLLDHMPEGISEFYCHPATRRWTGPDNLPDDYQVIEEFEALTSARVKAKVQRCGILTGSYADILGRAPRRREDRPSDR